MASYSPLEDLKGLEPGLREAGLSALYLFGSAVRDEAQASSDIDLLFEVETGRRFSLLDQARLRRNLATTLNRQVDLVERAALRPRIRRAVEAEMVRIF